MPSEVQNNSTLTVSESSVSLENTPKYCKTCNKVIEEHAIKALGNIYHQDCFKCYDCGNICRPKYFPCTLKDDDNDGKQVPLCQDDYFKRNNLICDVCKKLLQGTYYNAFGRLYDEEHFSCKICKETCSLQECFNFDGSLYCKYHYLIQHSKKCKGCEYPITEQHFEFDRSGKIYRWHPECYGIHRYWHIELRPQNLALPDFVKIKDFGASSKVLVQQKESLDHNIQISSEFTYKTWSILYRFEEEAANCISDMLQFLPHEDKTKGINAAALLVLKVRCLFKAIDSLESVSGGLNLDRNFNKEIEIPSNEESDNKSSENNGDSVNAKYKKYPKSFSSRVMMYLQLLRKYDATAVDNENLRKENINANEDIVCEPNDDQEDNDDTSLTKGMSIINGISHYLKLLIKFGIYNALEYNKNAHSTNALEKFLREVNKSTQFKNTPFSFIKDVSIDSNDSCEGCHKYIQQECIMFQNKRWHVNCMKCDKCKKTIERYDILDANFNKKTEKVLCPLCSTSDPNSVSGFKPVTRLEHLTYLLKIALIKTRALVIIQMQNQNVTNEVRANTMLKEQSYIRTLNDIKNLRSKRNSLKIKASADKNSIDNSNGEKGVNHSEQTISQFNNNKTLTLDDISRIVAMKQARGDNNELGLKNKLLLKKQNLEPQEKKHDISSEQKKLQNMKISSGFKHFNKVNSRIDSSSSDIFYSELSLDHLYRIQLISLAILSPQNEKLDNILDYLKKNSQPIIVSSNMNNKFWNKLKSHNKKNLINPQPHLLHVSENNGSFASMSTSPPLLRYNSSSGNILPNSHQNNNPVGKHSAENLHQVFGVSLSQLTEAYGTDSDLSLGSTRIRIPLLLDELIASLKQLDLSMEGLFRINGNIKRLRLLTEEMNINPTSPPDFSDENAIQLAALLKKFLRELPEPLLTTKFFKLWVNSIGDIDQMKLVYCLLPKYHRNCCEVLFSFLKYVSTFASGSKMNVHNLATVFAPNLLYSSEDANVVEGPGLSIEVVETLIDFNEDMVLVPEYLMVLLKETLDLRLACDFAVINEFLKTKNNQ
ncbi:hypothetical protein QEN19_002290 [Hanseniaspora menglaensis]